MVAPTLAAVCGLHAFAAELGSFQKPFVISRDSVTNTPASQLPCGKLIELHFAPADTGVQCVLQPIGQDPRLPSAAITNQLRSLRPLFWALSFAGYSPEMDEKCPVCAAFDLEKSTLVLCLFNLTGEARQAAFHLEPLRHTFTQVRTTTVLPGGRDRDTFKELDLRVDGIFQVAAPKDSIVLVILEDWVRDEQPARRADTRSPRPPSQTK
jgi:hypothetical protein